jgi:hypothetical protein
MWYRSRRLHAGRFLEKLSGLFHRAALILVRFVSNCLAKPHNLCRKATGRRDAAGFDRAEAFVLDLETPFDQ